jgi:hypothetical protein
MNNSHHFFSHLFSSPRLRAHHNSASSRESQPAIVQFIQRYSKEKDQRDFPRGRD